MTSTLFALLLLLAIVLLWLDGARARELACAVVDELCRRRGYQLLDETVALARIGLVRTDRGLRIKRLFRFDYSVEGTGRQQGHVLLHGSRAVWLDLAESEPEEQHAEATPPTSAPKGDNVIPFQRR